jgi:hypothetical protein
MDKIYQYPTELFFDAYFKGIYRPYDPPRLRVPNKQGGSCSICGRSDMEFGFVTYRDLLFEYKRRFDVKGNYKTVLSKVFGEYSTLAEPSQELTCQFCESVVRPEFLKTQGLICSVSSVKFLVGKDKSTRIDNAITKKDIKDYLMDPPEPPFVMAFNREGNPGHFLPMATVNYSRDKFIVNLFNASVLIDRTFLKKFAAALPGDKKKPGFNEISLVYTWQSLLKEGEEGNTFMKQYKKVKTIVDAGLLWESVQSDNLAAVKLYLSSHNAANKHGS